ncbi:MAG: S9 family peptidase [Verrucomicrobia bacterium]|nr:S9 family peptidase [Verrucomicrobiota bacterium]
MLLTATACGAAPVPWNYPAAPRGAVVDDYHGVKVADPYRWLEDLDSPATRAWVDAERALTASVLDQMPERAAIRARLTALWNYPRTGLPSKRGGHYLGSKNNGLQNQSVLYVRDQLHGSERVLIDPNSLSPDGTVALGPVSVSEDGKWIVYALKTAGSDWEEFRVRDIATGRDLDDRVTQAKYWGAHWTRDGLGFIYSRFPESRKDDPTFNPVANGTICYHRLGTPESADVLVYEDRQHPHRMQLGSITDDGRYLVINSNNPGQTGNALAYIDLGDPMHPNLHGPVVPLLADYDANYDLVGNRGDTFLVETNRGAPRGKIVAISLNDPGPARWRTLVPESADELDHVAYVGGRFVISYLHDVRSRLAVFAADGRPIEEISLPGIGSVTELGGLDREPELFYAFSSFLSPTTVMRYDLDARRGEVLDQDKVAFDPSGYTTEQVWVTSRDGTRVPMFLLHRKDLVPDGTAPAWLYGYGGFNIAMRPAFSVPTLVWLELGGVYAFTNLRGGGEFGEAWHLAGTKERKQNVFDDYIAAAEWLVAHRYTRPERLVLQGRSNGGLLVGAVINQRPDLAAVAFPQVGVMDMLRYHRFTVGASWAGDYGTSDTPAGFAYLRAYSPLHNIRTGARYPAVLITTGDHDDRVHPAHSFKYAAALQAAVTGSAVPALIRIDVKAGHGGSTGTTPVSKTIDEWTDLLGFVAHRLGLELK